MNRRGKVYYGDQLAGTIEEGGAEGFTFTYDPTYLSMNGSRPISLTLPLREKSYTSRTMIPFFDGLIPEGWLLDIVERNWKINARDRMGLLLACCRDCIGAVSVIEEPGDSSS
jgi:serine/threonine-protein kinase HipA